MSRRRGPVADREWDHWGDWWSQSNAPNPWSNPGGGSWGSSPNVIDMGSFGLMGGGRSGGLPHYGSLDSGDWMVF